MGLYICRNLVQKYEGKISVKYAPLGEGATFEILLPCGKAGAGI
jgi:signal transduction histidine kinase